MRVAIRAVMLVAAMAVTHAMVAQAPAGSTGQCKDGTYTTAASKMGACRGHKGVKEWYAASTGAAAGGPTATPGKVGSSPEAHTGSVSTASPSTMSTAPAKGASSTSTTTQTRASKPAAGSSGEAAPGGGPGMVWVNSESNVYHCPGTKFYGKTKAGSYMTEAEAKAKGSHADHGHACSK